MTFSISSRYPYLAGVGITEEILKQCCIQKGVVKKLNSRQTITVEIDEVEYEDVPVWIHTDCGARFAAIKETELINPEDYFKDAALMFPIPGVTFYNISDTSIPSVEPQVFVIVRTVEETKTALGVIGIVQNIAHEFPSDDEPFSTYKPYIYFTAKWQTYGIAGTIKYKRHYLYDVFEEKIAEIPTYNETTNVPELPMVEVNGILDADKDDLFTFLYGAILLRSSVIGSSPDHFDIGHGISSCYQSDGTEITPGATVTNHTYGTWPVFQEVESECDYGSSYEEYSYCYNGEKTGYFSAVHGGTVVLSPASSQGEIKIGQTNFEDDFYVRILRDETYEETFEETTSTCVPNDPSQGFYGKRTYDNPSNLVSISITIGDTTVTVTTGFLYSRDYGTQDYVHFAGPSWTLELDVWNLNNWAMNKTAQYFYDARISTPNNFICSCRGYALFQSGYIIEEDWYPTYPPADYYVHDLENIVIAKNTVFREDSLVMNIDNFYTMAANATRNLLLDMYADDETSGAWKGIDQINICFVPFNMDIALLE